MVRPALNNCKLMSSQHRSWNKPIACKKNLWEPIRGRQGRCQFVTFFYSQKLFKKKTIITYKNESLHFGHIVVLGHIYIYIYKIVIFLCSSGNTDKVHSICLKWTSLVLHCTQALKRSIKKPPYQISKLSALELQDHSKLSKLKQDDSKSIALRLDIKTKSLSFRICFYFEFLNQLSNQILKSERYCVSKK